MERLPDPSDRRGVLVRLTAEGRDRADQALAGLLEPGADDAGRAVPRVSVANWPALLRQLTAPFDNIPG